MSDINEKLNSIDIDNNIFLSLIAIALFNLNNNNELKEYYLYNNKNIEEIRNNYILTNNAILVIFFVNLKRSLDSIENLDVKSKEYKLLKMRILGSYLFIIGQLISIYYIENTDELYNDIF